MLRLILVFALAGMASIAQAKDIYFYDLLKDPVYARSWTAALNSAKSVPAWLRDEDRYVASPAKTVSIDAKTYSVSVLAMQHATNEGQAAVMFNADGSQAWAEIQEEGKPTLYLAKPSETQKTVLDNALAE